MGGWVGGRVDGWVFTDGCSDLSLLIKSLSGNSERRVFDQLVNFWKASWEKRTPLFGSGTAESQFFLIATEIFPFDSVLTVLQSAIKTLVPARRRQKYLVIKLWASSSFANSYVIDFSLERRSFSTAGCSGRPRCLELLNLEICWNRPATSWAKVASTKDEDGTVHALRVHNTDDNKILEVEEFIPEG